MSKSLAFLSLIASIAIMFFGVMVTQQPPDIMKGWSPYMKWIIGFVLLVYGAFRFYRAIRILRTK
jgi:hypothetical protein